jgi:catechol 2,3-dioxygenase-like lactoylglutathione lyase family enzyme
VTKARCLFLAAVRLTVLFAPGPANAQSFGEKSLDSGQGPSLVNTCLITKNVKESVKFYRFVLERDAQMSSADYAEFHTGVGVLAIFSAEAQDRYIPGSATVAHNRSVVLEFRVADVDKEYLRLQKVVNIWVKPPTTQPWGTRSIYFRDPDGNLVDFYSRPDAP